MKREQAAGFTLIAGTASIVAGVFMLAGSAWALIAFGAVCGALFIAVTYRRGPTDAP